MEARCHVPPGTELGTQGAARTGQVEWDEFLERMAEGAGGERWEAYRTQQIEITREWASRDQVRATEALKDLPDKQQALRRLYAHRAWWLADARALFAMFDVDGDGKLNKDEYEAYLRNIGVWGKGPYTDDKWDETWPIECANMHTKAEATDGVIWEGFERILYGKLRLGCAPGDLAKCKAQAGVAETPSGRSLRVSVPAGVGPGETVQVEADGQQYQAVVPAGLTSGDTFEMQLP